MTCKIKPSIEFNFVLLCTHRDPDNKIIERINNAYTPSLDWNLAYEIALKQRVLPLFYINIKAILPEKVPDKIMNQLKTEFFSNAVRNTYFCSFLLKVLNLLKENNIIAVPFKGPVLAQDIYGSIDFRQFADLDILVSIKDAVTSWNILMFNEFEPTLDLNNAQKQKYIKSEDHMVFLKESLRLELHWEITGIYLTKPIRLENIKSRLNQISILKQVVNNLSSEILLVYLCIHGTKHGWERLEQVCCIDQILKTKNIDWDHVEAITVFWKCKKMVTLGLYLSKILLETPLPEHVQNKVDIEIAEFAQMAISSILKNNTNKKVGDITNRFSFFHIRIRDSFTDKLRYLFKLIFSPTDKEWQYYPVPAYFAFLHLFLRPYRLIVTKLCSKPKN